MSAQPALVCDMLDVQVTPTCVSLLFQWQVGILRAKFFTVGLATFIHILLSVHFQILSLQILFAFMIGCSFWLKASKQGIIEKHAQKSDRQLNHCLDADLWLLNCYGTGGVKEYCRSSGITFLRIHSPLKWILRKVIPELLQYSLTPPVP